MRAAATAGDKQTLAPSDVIAMLRAAAGGIQQRGGAVLGDKTLLDALIPATDALEAALARPDGTAALQFAAKEARRAAEATASMIARKGRAAYTGERSIGSVDAGAVAIAVIAEGISAAWRERYETGKESA